MEVQVESAGGLLRRLHVTIPADRFEREVGERIKRFASRARVPGFRPGKAPLKVIQQQYGADARAMTRSANWSAAPGRRRSTRPRSSRPASRTSRSLPRPSASR